MSKTAKLIMGINLAATTLVVGGCASSSPIVYEESEEEVKIDSNQLPPEVEGCPELEYDEEEDVWVCDDDTSPYYRNYYYGGSFFPTLALLQASSAYRSAVKSGTVRPRSTQGTTNVTPNTSTTKPSTSTTPSSGFGSGTKTGGSYGG